VTNEADNINRTPRFGALVDDETIAEEIDGQDLAIVLSRFNIGAIEKVVDYRKGSRRAAKMIVITAKGQFLLKRRACGRDGRTQVDFAHAVQRRLAEHRFPVAGLIETIDGETIVEHEGRIYELFRFIQGKRFDRSNPAAAESGRVLAHFHDILRQFPNEPETKYSFHLKLSFASRIGEVVSQLKKYEPHEHLEGIETTVEFLQSQYENAFTKVESVDFPSLPTSIVHSDWHPGNMLYKDGEIIAVIDFDSLKVSPRVSDIANGALQFSMRMGDAENVDSWPDSFRGHTIQSLVQSYDQFTKLPLMASERSIIPFLMIEALIVESVIPILKTGSFGRVRGSSFIRMIERKLRWLEPRAQRVIDVIQPSMGEEDNFA
jgi:Ser/Thr protein kinase RdoA (MazF antagonist)